MSNEKSLVKQDQALDTFVKFINHAPPKDRVLNHPMASGVHYIPIGDIETMLDKVFKTWYVEILREGQLLNSVYVTVRLYYMHPILKEWQHQDGVGAVAIQTDKGKSAAEIASIKSNAIMLALPAAKSFAIKDAAEHIGKSFGRDINRKDVMMFNTDTINEGISPTNQLITVDQIKELELMTMEYSGQDEAGAAAWFHEIIGIQYSQVRKFEFNAVKDELERQRVA